MRGKPQHHRPAKPKRRVRRPPDRTTTLEGSADPIKEEDEQKLQADFLNPEASPVSEKESLQSGEDRSITTESMHEHRNLLRASLMSPSESKQEFQNLLHASAPPLGAHHALQLSTKALATSFDVSQRSGPRSLPTYDHKYLRATEEELWKVPDLEASTQQPTQLLPQTSLDYAFCKRWGCSSQQGFFDDKAPGHDAAAAASITEDGKQELLSHCQQTVRLNNSPTQQHVQAWPRTRVESLFHTRWEQQSQHSLFDVNAPNYDATAAASVDDLKQELLPESQKHMQASPQRGLEYALDEPWERTASQHLFDVDSVEHEAMPSTSVEQDVPQQLRSYFQHQQQQDVESSVRLEVPHLGESCQENQQPPKDSSGDFETDFCETVPTSSSQNCPEDTPGLHEIAAGVQTVIEENLKGIAMHAIKAIRNQISLMHDNHTHTAGLRTFIPAYLLNSSSQGMLSANLHPRKGYLSACRETHAFSGL